MRVIAPMLFVVLMVCAAGCENCDRAEGPGSHTESAAVRSDSGVAQLVESFELDLPCPQDEKGSDSPDVFLTDLRAYRTGADIQGNRLAGCVHNFSEESVDSLAFNYHLTAGDDFLLGGGMTVSFPALKPGESGAFVSQILRTVAEMEGETEVELKLDIVSVQGVGKLEFDTPSKIPWSLAARPTHPMEEHCRSIDIEDGDGDAWISVATLEPMPQSRTEELRLVGCISNRTSEPMGVEGRGLPEDSRESYVTYGRNEVQGSALSGRSGSVFMESVLDVGETRFFVSDFTVKPPTEPHSIQPAQRSIDEMGLVEYEPAGPVTAVHW